jgi:O-antigen ligase
VLEIGGSTYDSTTARLDFLKILLFSGVIGLVLAISAYSPYLGFSALALFLTALMFGLNLRRMVLTLIFLLPFDPQIEIRQGFNLYLDLFYVIPFAVFLWRVAFAKARVHWAALSLGPYVLFAIATSFWRAENLYWFAGYSTRLVVAILFAAVVAVVGRAETVVLVLGASLVPQVIYGMYQVVAGESGSLYLMIYPHYQNQPWTDRAYGFFFQPNNFGSYCATVSVMLLALGIRAKSVPTQLGCYALAGLGFVGLAGSGSRGAWLAALAALALLFLYSRARLVAKFLLVGAAVVGALAAQSIQYAPLARAGNLDDFTVQGRLTLYLAGVLLFLQHPLIGVGLTNFQEFMPYTVDWAYGVGTAAHDTYLQILSENGIIGFLLFFGPLLYLLYRNLKIASVSTTALMSAVGLVAILVHALFDFQFTTAPQYLLLFAVVYGLASRCFILTPGSLGMGS